MQWRKADESPGDFVEQRSYMFENFSSLKVCRETNMVVVKVCWITLGGMLGTFHALSSHNSCDTSKHHWAHFTAEAAEVQLYHVSMLPRELSYGTKQKQANKQTTPTPQPPKQGFVINPRVQLKSASLPGPRSHRQA